MVRLDPAKTPSSVLRLREQLARRIVGQDTAVDALVRLYTRAEAGMIYSHRPLANVLLLGPTGTGKTYIVEVFTELLHHDSPQPIRPLRIDCAELQHSHEISKLIGSPPGYLGHRDTQPAINNEILSRQKTVSCPFSVILFDEVEKASDSLHKLLLGMMDKAQLTLGDNSVVDLSSSLIFLTSNLGAREIQDSLQGSAFGFQKSPSRSARNLEKSARNAARRKLPPEFWNRLDEVIVFEPLEEQDIRKIVHLELRRLQTLVWEGSRNKKFLLLADPTAKELIFKTGFDMRYGARHVRRSIDQHLLQPLASLVLSQQIETGDVILLTAENERIQFFHICRTSAEGLALGFDLFWEKNQNPQDIAERLKQYQPSRKPSRKSGQAQASAAAESAAPSEAQAPAAKTGA